MTDKPVSKKSLTARLAAELDPVGWPGATAKAALGAVRNPTAVAYTAGGYGSRLAAVPQNTARVALCLGAHRPSPEAAGDRRFADDAWSQNPAFFTLLEYYFAT